MFQAEDEIVFRWHAAGLAVACLAVALAVLTPSPVLAQSQPIQNAQDAACRGEAKARVFTAPDPQGLGLYAMGRQIYMSCMTRRTVSVGSKVRGKSRRVKRR